MRLILSIFTLFLLCSCASIRNDQTLLRNRNSHTVQNGKYWDPATEQYKKIDKNNSKLKYYLNSKQNAALAAHQSEWDNLEIVWPTSGTLTSKYGMRTLRKLKRMHKGIDIGARTGTPIYAAETGRVKSNGNIRGYGKAIILKHDSIHNTLYGHLSRIVVKNNQIVRKNQLIGYVGRTGYTTGSNLHFEMIVNGVAQDPLKFLPKSKGKRKVRVGEAIVVKNRHIATQSSPIHSKS